MRRFASALCAGGAIGVASLLWSSAFIADAFDHQSVLGRPFAVVAGVRFYAPWKVLEWSGRYEEMYPRPFAIAHIILFIGFGGALLMGAAIMRRKSQPRPFATHAWGNFADAERSGLFACQGTVLGKLDGEILCFDGPEHQLLVGASRSGKGRGQVVPTLLAWPHSALVLDIKGELADGDARHDFPGAAGFRQTLGPVLRFAPTRANSQRFNPLFEVRRGANEVRDVQNIVEILVDPHGEARNQDFWNRSAKAILVGVILHVLYTEPEPRKTLTVVREKLRDLDATALVMKATLHRANSENGRDEVHPEVLHAAESFLAGEERLQSGIKATAESFFGLFADELISANTAVSDFRIGDLMCAEHPVTLFVQPPPSDALRLTPLLRLLVNQIARALMEDQGADALGRAKRHRLILMLDEFPTLGRMPFFETMMGAMAGYGLKCFLVAQSLNHIIKAYGRDNVILDNCHIVTAFAAADTETAKRIAEMAGEAWEVRESETVRRPRPLFWPQGSTTHREERRPLLLAGDVRALARDEQLIFVAGAKPLRAKKLKFDREPIFTQRLAARPASASRAVQERSAVVLTTAHDWIGVRARGMLTEAAAKPRAKPALARRQPLQAELFASEPSISDIARAGFLDASGAPLPHPGARTDAIAAGKKPDAETTGL